MPSAARFALFQKGWIFSLTALMLSTFAQPAGAAAWKSGVRNNSYTTPFATWRATSNTVVSGFIDWKHGWSGMYTFASGSSPRTMRNKSSNVSFGHGLFPQGGSLSECAKGSYNDEQREVARRLAANGVGDAEIRLGWEASGDWFPWSAAGKPADQWKACFTNIAKAMKGQANGLRIGWFMAKKGRIDARTIYPADAPITNIGLSFYDDGQARFGTETYLGGPWGLQAWANFARGKGKKLAFGEWGVGRNGDNPAFITNMYNFLAANSSVIAHEAYFNSGSYQLYPIKSLPKSSSEYQKKF
jgi:hypothetical protein